MASLAPIDSQTVEEKLRQLFNNNDNDLANTIQEIWKNKYPYKSVFSAGGNIIGLQRNLFPRVAEKIAKYMNKNNINIPISDFFSNKSIKRGSGLKSLEHHDIQSGLQPEKIPDKVHFGKVVIFLKKLYYDNLLSVRRASSMASIPQLNVTTVSDRFVHIIMNLIGNIHPTHIEINSLPSQEKILYDRLIFLAGINRSTHNNKENSIESLKKRMKILEGEINAGNNNPKLKKELRQVVHSLKDFKIITNGSLKEYLKDILI